MRLATLLLLTITIASCGPKRPRNAIVVGFHCLELQHLAGSYSGGEAHFGEIIVRGSAADSCATLVRIDHTLFADANENGEPEPAEVLMQGSESYGEYTTSARLYPKSREVARGAGHLRYEVTIVNSQGESYRSAGLCPE